MNDPSPKGKSPAMEELIDYIAAVGFRLQRHPPDRYLLEIRLKKIDDEIDENLKQTESLIAAAKAQQINADTFRKRHNALMDEWHRLNSNRKKTEEKLYPKEAR
jgi:predicted nuclease with TOPRIM domain